MVSEDIDVIEKFIISLYCDDCNCFSIDLAPYEIYKYRQNMDIWYLPPTRDALIQRKHESAYVSGRTWGRANLSKKTDEPPSNLTWSISSDKILCNWISPNNTPLPKNLAKIAFKKCGCRLKWKKNCSCKKENVSCLPICKCWGKCDILWLKTVTFVYAFVLFYELLSLYLELNFISTFCTVCINLYRLVQMCFLRGIEDGKKVLSFYSLCLLRYL